jgi:hypothetical protein
MEIMSISLKNDAGTFSTNLNQSNPTANVNIALPTTSGTMALENGNPCFSAYQSVGQTLSDGMATKMLFQIEEFDLTSAYDTTTSKFTPQKAGYYQVNASIAYIYVASSNKPFTAYLYKNGTKIKEGQVSSSTAIWYPSAIISVIIYMNGTTDYLEIYGNQGSGANISTTAGLASVYFQAHYIGS